MPKIVIVGGKLQGMEAAYLGKEAGIEIILIDQNPHAPAQKLCSRFICGDVLSHDPQIREALDSADMILPTMENDAVLEGLTALSKERGYVLAFDWEAYKISSSKRRSDAMFAKHQLPCPTYYPKGHFPYIAKPEEGSGSHGVQYFEKQEELDTFLNQQSASFIIQEFVEGPSYSVEIIGRPGSYRTYEITEIFVDDGYDCNLAAAYGTIEPEKAERIQELARQIAEIIGLTGIMDLEVIDHHGEIKILEIDARLPSQTSIAVYHASGMNYIQELYDLFCRGDFQQPQKNLGKCAFLTQYFVDGRTCSCQGEHIMTEGGLLDDTPGIAGPARAITDYAPGKQVWRGSFIDWADDLETLKQQKALMEQELKNRFCKGGR